MIRLAISVEGQTEEEFVNRVLADHLGPKGVAPQPILLGGGGGDVTVERLASDMAKLYWSFEFVTSLVDFYGFRGKGSATPDELEKIIDERINRQYTTFLGSNTGVFLRPTTRVRGPAVLGRERLCGLD